MSTTVYIIAIGLALGIGFTLGMYVTTQIGDWIDKRRKNG